MKAVKFLFSKHALFMAAIFLSASSLSYAQSQTTEELRPSRDINAVREYRNNRVITQEQREEAAARAKAANPELAASIEQIRAKLIKARDNRVAEIEAVNNATDNNNSTAGDITNSNTLSNE